MITSKINETDKHESDVNKLLFHNNHLYSAADDGFIKMWSEDLQLIRQVKAHSDCINSIELGPPDELLSCSNDGTVKSWRLNTLEANKTLISDCGGEFWSLKYLDNVLYIGDFEGNVKVCKNGKFYGSINVAEPVKNLDVLDNILFTSNHNDIVITNLQLKGEKIQFGIKDIKAGRAPILLFDDKMIFTSRNGRDLILNDGKFREISTCKDAHEMIINAICVLNHDNGSIISSGWDKTVKKWLVNHSIELKKIANVEFVVNTLIAGNDMDIYAGGENGCIVRLRFE